MRREGRVHGRGLKHVVSVIAVAALIGPASWAAGFPGRAWNPTVRDGRSSARTRAAGVSVAKVIEAWEEPRHEEFAARTAWSLLNAFTEDQKGAAARAQMEESLRLSQLFRRELPS